MACRLHVPEQTPFTRVTYTDQKDDDPYVISAARQHHNPESAVLETY